MLSSISGRHALAITLSLGFGLPSFALASDDSLAPSAAAPSVQYRSVFRETSLGVEREKIDWRKANDDVGKFTRGHVDILKQEEMESKEAPKKPAAASPHKH